MLEVNIETQIGALDLRVTLPAAGGTTIVIGPNGAGKTTLLLSLLGALTPHRGVIALADERLLCTERGIDVPIEKRRIGYVPQRYALFPTMTVAQNVAFGIRECAGAERQARVAALLDELEIAHLGQRRPTALSGGESQRVALARALAIRPRALLLDEPMAALDAGARTKVRRFLASRLARIQIPTIVVSHDVADVEALGGRIAVLEGGRIVQTGTLDELRAAPATPFVEHFLQSEPDTPAGADSAATSQAARRAALAPAPRLHSQSAC